MTLPIARDLMNEGIPVNTILPGIFNTPLMNGAPQNVKVALAASMPFPKRFGHPAEYESLAWRYAEARRGGSFRRTFPCNCSGLTRRANLRQ